MNIDEVSCIICQGHGTLATPELPQWCDDLEKEEQEESFEEYGEFYEDSPTQPHIANT